MQFTTIQILEMLPLAASALMLVAIAIHDIKHFIIPNRYNLILLILGLVYAGLASFEGFAWGAHLAVFLIAFLSGALLFQLGLIGGGDAKLFAVVSFFAGTTYVAEYMFVMALAGGLLSLGYLAKYKWLNGNTMRQKENRLSLKEGAVLAVDTLLNPMQTIKTGDGSSPIRQPVPYGVAIAVGGLYVLINITVQLR